MQHTNDADYSDYFKQLLTGKTFEEVKKERQEVQEKLKDFPDQEQEKNKKEKEENVNKEQKKLERAFLLSHESRKLEIYLFWKRATFFFVSLSLLFTAYGGVWIKIINESSEIMTIKAPLFFLLFFLNSVGIFISWLWIKMIGSSKYWQNHWETHIAFLEPFFSGYLLSSLVSKEKYYSSCGVSYSIGWIIFVTWVVVYAITSYIPWDLQSYTLLSSRSISGIAGILILGSMFVVNILCKLPKKEVNETTHALSKKNTVVEKGKGSKETIYSRESGISEKVKHKERNDDFEESSRVPQYQNFKENTTEEAKVYSHEMSNIKKNLVNEEKDIEGISEIKSENKLSAKYGIEFAVYSIALSTAYITSVTYMLSLLPQHPGLRIERLLQSENTTQSTYLFTFFLLILIGAISYVSLTLFNYIKEKYTVDGKVDFRLIGTIAFLLLLALVYFFIAFSADDLLSFIEKHHYIWFYGIKKYIYHDTHKYLSAFSLTFFLSFLLVFMDDIDDIVKFIFCTIILSFFVIICLFLLNKKDVVSYEGRIYTRFEDSDFKELDINKVRVFNDFLAFSKKGRIQIIPLSAIVRVDYSEVKSLVNGTKKEISTRKEVSVNGSSLQPEYEMDHLASESNVYAKGKELNIEERNQGSTLTNATSASMDSNGTVLRYAMPPDKGTSKSVLITVTSMKKDQNTSNNTTLIKKEIKKKTPTQR